MINGLFEELSEEEMLSVNGACAGGAIAAFATSVITGVPGPHESH